MRNIILPLLFFVFAFAKAQHVQPTCYVSVKAVTAFNASFEYDQRGKVVSFDYAAIYKEVGDEGLEAFINAYGYTFEGKAKYIDAKKDHYRSGKTCKPMKYKACVQIPIHNEKTS